MAGPVLTRRLSEREDQDLWRIVRGEGRQSTIRVRRALMVRASADGARTLNVTFWHQLRREPLPP